MSNPFQDQLLKAGLVSKKQIQKANKAKHDKKKQQGSKKKAAPVDETKIAAQKAAKEKADQDRELNRKKEQQARKKAVSAEINQLIIKNRIERGDDCEIAYNFTHGGKVNRIYISNGMKQQIIQARSGIVSIDGRYELVPRAVAEKIQKRDESRVILFSDEGIMKKDDEYAEYQIPDDLIW